MVYNFEMLGTNRVFNQKIFIRKITFFDNSIVTIMREGRIRILEYDILA
jgi:hypothetical protein